MAYIPPHCERFTPCLEGWICCECGHFSGKSVTHCYNCNHERCPVLLDPTPLSEPGTPPKKRRAPAPQFTYRRGPGRPKKNPPEMNGESSHELDGELSDQ